jgi:hypothetical protein
MPVRKVSPAAMACVAVLRACLPAVTAASTCGTTPPIAALAARSVRLIWSAPLAPAVWSAPAGQFTAGIAAPTPRTIQQTAARVGPLARRVMYAPTASAGCCVLVAPRPAATPACPRRPTRRTAGHAAMFARPVKLAYPARAAVLAAPRSAALPASVLRRILQTAGPAT